MTERDDRGDGIMNDWRRIAIDQAMRLEAAKAHGAALGLTSEQTSEVVDTWTGWYQSTGEPVSYRAIQDKMTDRAMNEAWQPPSEDCAGRTCAHRGNPR